MPLFRARWDIDMGASRVTPGESVELDQDDPALPALLAAGVLELLPEPKQRQAPGAPATAATEKPDAKAPTPAPAEGGAPARAKARPGRTGKGEG
jgi:hypothetical protein